MIGKFKLKKVNNFTGKEEVVFSEENQLTEGIRHSMVNVLTGTGSKNSDDFSFKYFQLGDQKYDLSTFDISADVTSSAFSSYFWTLKSPLTKADYGKNSRSYLTQKPSYILGSVLPSGLGNTKVIDNFVQPPDVRTVLNEYSNTIAPQVDGDDLSDNYYNSHLSSVWSCGCANDFMSQPEHFGWNPLPGVQDLTMSGPDFKTPTWKYSYSTRDDFLLPDGSVAIDSICVRSNHSYIYKGPVADHVQNEPMNYWAKLRTNQTISAYFAGTHYVSSVGTNPWPHADTSAVSGTNLTGRLSIYNRSAGALIGGEAGQNSIDFLYRYNYDTGHGASAWPQTYTPCAISVSSGWQSQENKDGDALTQFSSVYGLTSESDYGVVSANIHNRYGALYTYSDHLNNYSSMNGAGATYINTADAGFGPSGNFYRVSLTWGAAPSKMVNYYKRDSSGTVYDGNVLVEMMRPCVSALSGIHHGASSIGGSGHIYPGSDPRQEGHISFVQWDWDTSATPVQNVHGEQSYYLTSSQEFVVIPDENTTRLNSNTTNVRLEVDEGLANSKTLREVGLYIKNPGGFGVDTPFLGAYKRFPCDINKTDQFSYIIDWEFSFQDNSVEHSQQTDPVDECNSSNSN